MEVVAIVIAIVSLALASVAYWRAGGRRDLDLWRAKQQEISETLLVALEEAYAASRQTLRQTAEGLRMLKDEAIEEVTAQVERTAQQLETLESRLAEGVQAVRASTLSAAHGMERTLRLRVRRLEARGSLLYAKASVILARRWAGRGELVRAEQRLDQATALVALARETLRGDHAYDTPFEKVKNALAEATAAVREKSENLQNRIEQVVVEMDHLLSALETAESNAAEQKAA